ncbi:MAG: hypothetical protein R2695_18955 [Acidimicrobiales bacterium]
MAALRDVLEAFAVEGMPSPAEFDDAVARDHGGLASQQNYDGGFGWWRQDQRSDPYVSVHVMHALFEAQANGYSVNGQMLENGRSYLRSIEQHIPADWGSTPATP